MIFDVNAMVWGSASIIRPDTGAAITGNVNLTDVNEPTEIIFDISGALDPVQVGVLLPQKQSNGSTDTTGTLTLTLQPRNQAGTAVGSAITKAYTLGTGQVDVLRVGRHLGVTKLGVLTAVSASGNAGVATIGLTLGGHDISRAG